MAKMAANKVAFGDIAKAHTALATPAGTRVAGALKSPQRTSRALSERRNAPGIRTGLTGKKDALARLLIDEIKQKDIDLDGEDVSSLAATLARILPSNKTNRIAQIVGPCYPQSVVAKWIGITRQAVTKRAAANNLLVCFTAEGDRLYPAFQFDDNAKTLPGLPMVLDNLAKGSQDGWTMALWLLAPNEQLGGVSAIDWLKAGRKIGDVVDQAARRAEVWAA